MLRGGFDGSNHTIPKACCMVFHNFFQIFDFVEFTELNSMHSNYIVPCDLRKFSKLTLMNYFSKNNKSKTTYFQYLWGGTVFNAN